MTPDRDYKTYVLTLGDAAGSSPELLPPLLQARRAQERLIVVGPPEVRERVVPSVTLYDRPQNAATVQWVAAGAVTSDKILSGSPDAVTGEAAYRALNLALELLEQYPVHGLLTLPLSKQAVQEAGHPRFVGHTEMLEEFWGCRGVMSFFGDRLNVGLLTRHCALHRVHEELTRSRIINQIRVADDFFRDHGRTDPAFAVLGLNPHAGEGGNMGNEERDVLEPALEQARSEGLNVKGPCAPDSFFGTYDGSLELVFACYHDQGLIPFKQHHFLTGVHATLGLPVLRVSPDHGTAQDLAGEGTVDPRSALNGLDWLREWSQPAAS